MSSRFVVVTLYKPVLQGMGFNCKTEGNWSCREKESKVLQWIIWHTLQCHPSNEGRDRPIEYASEGGRVIDSWRIHGAGMS